MSKALLIVDVQYDFLPGGALGVEGGDEVIPVINALTKRFGRVVACQDWHPPGHMSFASSRGKPVGEVVEGQILWPDHCVQGTRGAELSEALDTSKVERIFHKGVDPDVDSYGAFYDNGRQRDTGLKAYLQEQGIDHLYVAGLTTDYCVKYSVLDGLEEGFRMTVVRDACRPVNLEPGDEQRAYKEMIAAGAEVVESKEILRASS